MKEHTRDLLKRSRPAALSYDRDRGVFHVDGREIAVQNFPESDRDLALGHDRKLTDDEIDLLIESAPVVQTIVRAIALPKLYDWLRDDISDDVLKQTADVMREVFIELRPDMANVSRGSHGFMGFSAEQSKGEPPHIFLQTLGTCACMSVSRSGIFGDRFWSDKVASFSYHNVDTHAQKTSLLAGLGHLAHRAAQQV